jgi:hypothetical protein
MINMANFSTDGDALTEVFETVEINGDENIA